MSCVDSFFFLQKKKSFCCRAEQLPANYRIILYIYGIGLVGPAWAKIIHAYTDHISVK